MFRHHSRRRANSTDGPLSKRVKVDLARHGQSESQQVLQAERPSRSPPITSVIGNGCEDAKAMSASGHERTAREKAISRQAAAPETARAGRRAMSLDNASAACMPDSIAEGTP